MQAGCLQVQTLAQNTWLISRISFMRKMVSSSTQELSEGTSCFLSFLCIPNSMGNVMLCVAWEKLSILEMEGSYRMKLVDATPAVHEIDVYLSDFLDYLTEVLIKLR